MPNSKIGLEYTRREIKGIMVDYKIIKEEEAFFGWGKNKGKSAGYFYIIEQVSEGNYPKGHISSYPVERISELTGA